MLNLIFHPIYSQLQLPRNHRFPIEKYQSLHDMAVKDLADRIKVNQVEQKVSVELLHLVHDESYIHSFLNGTIDPKAMRRIGFEWSEQFRNRTLTAVGGTIQTANTALENGIAINLTGGYHHAHPDFGSGFCVFNDLAIAAHHAINSGLANRVLIFDCDVHQGDGTATCCEANPNIYTVSIHCEKNFPARKAQSDWDVGLEKSCDDESFLSQATQTLLAALHSFRPDFIIYDAGVDIHINDDLGLINVTTDGVYQRDLEVFTAAKNKDIPIMAVIGGGYQRDINTLTQVHFQLLKAASQVFK